MVEQPTKTIEEITETLIDYRGKTPPKTTSGVKLITAKVIKDGFIVHGDHEYISEQICEKWMRRGLPRQWDILITTEAPLGEVAQLRTAEKVALAQRVILLRGNPQKVDQQYYFQALKSPFVQAQLQARATGTTVLGVKQSELRRVEIPYHPLSTQRKIAGILSAYDDLIENNTRRIQILGEMAQAIYREWFLHFRFPGHEEVEMVDSELGFVPAGWEVKPLEEICILIVGQSPKSKYYNEEGEGLPFHQGVSYFGSRFPKHEVYCTVDKRVAETGDILFSVRAPVGRINIADRKLIVGRGLHAIRSKKGYQGFIFHQLSERFYEEDMMGGGTIFKSVTKADMLSLPLLVPLDSIVERFEQLVAPISAQIANLTKKNDNLRETRDLLLPKLVSGEVDVSEMAVGSEPLNH